MLFRAAGGSNLESLRRVTRREPAYVYLMLLASFVLTGLVFTGLYVILYPYLAIAPPTGSGAAGGTTGPRGVVGTDGSYIQVSRDSSREVRIGTQTSGHLLHSRS